MGRPLHADGRVTRDALLDAALDVFAEKGFHGASLKEIAAKVGVRDSAIYHYFESKEALFEAVVQRGGSVRAEYEAAIDAPVEDVRELLVRLTRTIVEQMELPRNQKLYRIFMSDGLRPRGEARVDLLRPFLNRPPMLKLMERLSKEGWLRRRSPDLLALEFMAPINLRVMLRMTGLDHALLRDSSSFARAHVDHFLGGSGTTEPKRATRHRTKLLGRPSR